MSTKTFMYEGGSLEDGTYYKFEVELFVEDGVVQAKVTVHAGEGNFNAFYHSDGENDTNNGTFENFDAKKDKSLNMNGEGSKFDGEPVEWDGGVKLSNPGLGKTPPDTYLVASGDPDKPTTATFPLDGFPTDLDDIELLGIRVTSTNAPGGSLKLVGDEYTPPEEPTDHFPDLDRDISYVLFYFDGEGVKDLDTSPVEKDKGEISSQGDGYITIKINIPDEFEGNDCVNNLDTWYKNALGTIYDTYPALEDATLLGVEIKGGKNLFEDSNLYDQDFVFDNPNSKSSAFFELDNDPGNEPFPSGEPISDKDIDYTLNFDEAWIPDTCDEFAFV
ncbi:hypothetical protein [Alkalilacustris brevis]|uniref:hypothetical protein n=1 Tax=Alkalilacustris brevis TaxID=2026338 RepID=UPI000E0D2883|nr:hypothetical protein [Alkalilacustris brevis]